MEGKAPESFRLKRSKSITSISEVHMKLLRLEDFLLELPSKIESIKKMPQQLLEKRNEMIAKKRLAENKMESGDYPKAPFQPKVLLILLLPFMPVFFYSLLVFFSSVFLFIYMIFIMLYFVFLVAYFIAELAIRPPWYKPNRQLLTKEQIPAYWQGICNNPKVDLQLDYEDVEFVTKYDMVLRGWFVPAPTNVTHHNIGICFVHGGGRDRRAFLRHVPIFHYQGYDCLLFDFSEHGMSDGTGRGFSYGIREKEDVRFAVKWMKEVKGVKRVVVVGTSVGASSAIMAAAEDPSIDAVIAENPVACAEDFALYHLKTMLAVYAPNTYNSFFFKPFYMLVSRIFLLRIGAVFGYNRPYQLVDKLSPRPILLMHGTNDDVVPWDHSQRLFDAAKDPKELWLAENAWHCALFDMHPEDYGKKIHEFLNRYMHAELVDQKPLHSSKQVNVTTEEEEQKEKEEKEPRSAEEKEKEKEEAERARAQIHLVSDGGRTEEKTEEGGEEQN